jgi:hypothetical protein
MDSGAPLPGTVIQDDCLVVPPLTSERHALLIQALRSKAWLPGLVKAQGQHELTL